MPKTVTKKETRHLKVNLTEDEKKELAERLADSVREKSSLESEKKSVMSSYKARIEEQDAACLGSAQTLSNGFEYRKVECEALTDYVHKSLTVRRLDTMEIVEERALRVDELQIHIDDEVEIEGDTQFAEKVIDEMAKEDPSIKKVKAES